MLGAGTAGVYNWIAKTFHEVICNGQEIVALRSVGFDELIDGHGAVRSV
ncbi:hypothetical protein BH23CHL5_BH23CHL5_04590 [soil metagenome]